MLNSRKLSPSAARTGWDPEGVLFSEGQIHWAAVQSREGEGYQVKAAFVWRAGSQSGAVIRKLWITTELSWQGRDREP